MSLFNIPMSLSKLVAVETALQQLQQTTPDTSNYMVAGFGVIFGAMLIYLISLIARGRNLRQDLDMLQELENRPNSPLNSASPVEKHPSG
jgi:hypothetical protein